MTERGHTAEDYKKARKIISLLVKNKVIPKNNTEEV